MKVLNKSLCIASLASGMLLATIPSVSAEPQGWSQYGDRFGDIRGVINRSQNDLRRSERLEENNGDQRERYRNAQGHLSTFDRHLTQGNFDRSELDRAVHDMQHILNKNSLQASARDALLRDIEDLRAIRYQR